MFVLDCIEYKCIISIFPTLQSFIFDNVTEIETNVLQSEHVHVCAFGWQLKDSLMGALGPQYANERIYIPEKHSTSSSKCDDHPHVFTRAHIRWAIQ